MLEQNVTPTSSYLASAHGAVAEVSATAFLSDAPLKLSHRGLGELDVALTPVPASAFWVHGAGGGPVDAEPWLLAIVIALAILFAGIPDQKADHKTGKWTLVIRLRTVRIVLMTIGFLGLSAVGTLAVAMSAVSVGRRSSLLRLAITNSRHLSSFRPY